MAIGRLIKDEYLKSIGKTLSYLEDISHNTGIYKWTNKINGKIYIGLAVKLDRRRKAFYYFSNLYAGDLINKARNRYNNSQYWDYEILEYCTKQKLDERETYYINLFKSYDRTKGYNLSLGGEGLTNPTEETKEKIRLKRMKPVVQIDIKTKEIIRVWESAKEIEINLGYDASGITKCCKGKRVSIYGYNWQYFNNPVIPKINIRRKAVIKIDKNTNEIIEEFESITKASISVNGYISNIRDCCIGKQKTAFGFKWKYKE